MDAFISRKRRRITPPIEETRPSCSRQPTHEEEESTDVKLAILSSLHADRSHDDLLEILLHCDGSVETALEILSSYPPEGYSPRKKRPSAIGIQSALPYLSKDGAKGRKALQPLTKKGKTLHLYTPEDIAAHTPCSIIHNFLPTTLANDLLEELLPEVTTYTSATFKLFDNIVQSPHTACFYVSTPAEAEEVKYEYLYNGSSLEDIRQILPVMQQVSAIVRPAVNSEIATRIKSHYPDGKKLKYQSPKEWLPNAAFVNCYDGGAQSVGYHADQLSYLGPRAVIGSLSLGVAREFRVRKIVPKDDPDETPPAVSAGDTQGQIAIHLPHNSLLVMHAEMQEEWKHSIAPALSIDPHPITGNKRINITYRWYREEFHPKHTPKCRCGVPTVLKCVQRRKETRGKYMWMCQVGSRADIEKKNDAKGRDGGCGFFEWAGFTDDGMPIWKHKNESKEKKPREESKTRFETEIKDDKQAEANKETTGRIGYFVGT